jgi:hypothetical protein
MTQRRYSSGRTHAGPHQSSPPHPLPSRRLLEKPWGNSLEVGKGVLRDNDFARQHHASEPKTAGATNRFDCFESFKTPSTGAKRTGRPTPALDGAQTGTTAFTCAPIAPIAAPHQNSPVSDLLADTQVVARKSGGPADEHRARTQALRAGNSGLRVPQGQPCDTRQPNADLARGDALGAVRSFESDRSEHASQPVQNPQKGPVITLSQGSYGISPAQARNTGEDNQQSPSVGAEVDRVRAVEATEGHAGRGAVLRPRGLAEGEMFFALSVRPCHTDFSPLKTSAGNTCARLASPRREHPPATRALPCKVARRASAHLSTSGNSEADHG